MLKNKFTLIVVSSHGAASRITKGFSEDYQCDRVRDLKNAAKALSKKRYEFMFIDLKILLGPNLEIPAEKALAPYKKNHPALEIIVITSQDKISQAVEAVKAGAGNYLVHPVASEEVKYVAQGLVEKAVVQSELDYLRDRFLKIDALDDMQTNSPAMKKVFSNIRAVAPTRSTVLLSGETGVGKGVTARLVHQHSSRSDGAFISVHCGAIPDTLLESELFGHEKGAFTGALKRKLGRFETAKGGTIFLDEIGATSAQAQIKLLQVLQEETFQRVGGEHAHKTDVRIIAATNADLKLMAEEGQFRKDLYYRLNVFPITIPPLKDRIEDIEILILSFLRTLNAQHSKEIVGVHDQALDALESYDWPGNIRELKNMVERAHILENSNVLTPESFPMEIFTAPKTQDFFCSDAACSLAAARKIAIEKTEKAYLRDVLTRQKGRINQSAKVAGVGVRQLHKLMTKHGLSKTDFK